MAELKIYGPEGNPKTPPVVNRYTKVPYDDIKQQEVEARAKKEAEGHEESRKLGVGEEWKLGDKNTVLSAFFWYSPLVWMLIFNSGFGRVW